VRPLPDDLLEGRDVGQRNTGVPGQQLQQLQVDVADLAPAVQGIQRAERAPADVRQAQRDRVQPRQRRPDQVVEAARLAGGHEHGLARPHQLADGATGQVGRAPAERLGQAVQADQAQPVALDDHEAAGVGAGQLPQAGRDPVQHRLQVELGVHVGHDVTQPPHDPGPLGHVMPYGPRRRGSGGRC